MPAPNRCGICTTEIKQARCPHCDYVCQLGTKCDKCKSPRSDAYDGVGPR